MGPWGHGELSGPRELAPLAIICSVAELLPAFMSKRRRGSDGQAVLVRSATAPARFSRSVGVTRAEVRKLISASHEHKFIDVNVSGGLISYSGTVARLDQVVQGDSDQTRTGDSVDLKEIQLRGGWEAADNYNVMRLIIFQASAAHSTSSLPTPSDILLAGYVGTGSAVYAPYDKDRTGPGGQYKILYDKTMTADTDDPVTTFQTTLRRGFRKRVQYIGGTTSATGGIFMLLISDSAAITHPGTTWVSRVVFTDA